MYDLHLLREPFGSYPTEVVEATDELPYPQLYVGLDPDERGRSRQAEIIMYPGMEEPPVLQIVVPMRFSVPEERGADYARVAMIANNLLPLLGYGAMEGEGTAFFRALLPVGAAGPDAELVATTVFVILEIDTTFSPILEGFATGELDLDEAVEALQQHVGLGDEAEEVLFELDD